MNPFAQYENPGEVDDYDERRDPRYLSDQDLNTPDHRGIHYRIRFLEEIEED